MFTKDFWLGDNGALARCIRTAAQTAIATITVSTFTPFAVGAWVNVLVLSGVAGFVSLLMSLDRREALFTEPPVLEHNPEVIRALPDHGAGCGDDLR